MMIPAWWWHWLWHGIRGGIVGGGSAAAAFIQASSAMPKDWEWVLIAITAAVGFVNGVESYATEPQ